MTNPKQAPEAQRPICDKPGCGLEMCSHIEYRKRSNGHGNDRVSVWGCTRGQDAHRLCAQLAERDARIAELLKEAKKDTDAMFSAAQTCRDGKQVVESLRAQLSEANAVIVTLREALEGAKDDAGERRDYASGWEWKHGTRWDEEDAKVAAALSTTSHAHSAAVERIMAEERNGCWSRVEGYIADGVRLECVEDFERLAKDALFFEPKRERLDE